MSIRRAVFATALNLEYRQVRRLLGGSFRLQSQAGTRYETSKVRLVSGMWAVTLVLAGRENSGAAVQIERAIATFNPEVVLLIGIAGGRWDCQHGDVIAADVVYDYETGSDSNSRFSSRAKSLPASYSLTQTANAVAREARWIRRIKPLPEHQPRAFVSPIAAGSKVVTGIRSRTARLIDLHCEDARGVETEGFGAMHAAYVNDSVDAMVIRGVSDLLDDKSAANDELCQPVAARNAGAFAIELLSQFNQPSQRGGGMRDRRASPEERTSQSIKVKGDNNVTAGGNVNILRVNQAEAAQIRQLESRIDALIVELQGEAYSERFAKSVIAELMMAREASESGDLKETSTRLNAARKVAESATTIVTTITALMELIEKLQ